MALVITILIGAILTAALPFIDNILVSIIPIALHAENYMSSIIGTNWFNDVYNIFFAFGMSMIVLKFLKKGFDIYIGWMDGDADADPLGLLTNFLRAMVVAISFPTLYRLLAQVVTELTDQLLIAIGTGTDMNFTTIITGIVSAGIFTGLVSLIFFIMFFVLYIQFLTRGVEILILRIGMPFACVGLIDNDKGVFGPYLKKFFQSTLAIIVQLSLCKLGVAMMLNSHIFWAVACMALALKAPKFLSEFILMSGSGGGGMMNKIYYSSRIYSMAKAVIKR